MHQNTGQAVARVDYQLSNKQSIFARYINNTDHKLDPHALAPDNILTTGSVGIDDMFNSLVFGDTYIIKRTW